MSCRKGRSARQTTETKVDVELNLDGAGESRIGTGIQMLDHFLTQIARHGMLDLSITATGDDQHHVVEDVAICFGQALSQALGDKRGIVRMAHALVPMDEALSCVAIDISGRGGAHLTAPFSHATISELEADMVRHFFISLAVEARITLHARVEAGENDHHKAESLFKAFGRALRCACAKDPRSIDVVPSSKGTLAP